MYYQIKAKSRTTEQYVELFKVFANSVREAQNKASETLIKETGKRAYYTLPLQIVAVPVKD